MMNQIIIEKLEIMKIIQDGFTYRNCQKKKAAIVTDDDLLMFERATIYSNPVAIVEKGRLVKIYKCKNTWCKVKSGKFKGWIKKENLWGLF